MQSDNSYRTTPQAPIHSGFGPHTTAREVLRGHDLRGKTALVTGGYSGIGLETTRALAEAGATVIVPARTPAKARASMGGIPRVALAEMDLIDPASVDACAHRVLHSGWALHTSSIMLASWPLRWCVTRAGTNRNSGRAPSGPQWRDPGAIDPDAAERLWQLSEEMTGVQFSN